MQKEIRWLIPQKHTLETIEECLKLLEEGYTLINNYGYTTYLFKGQQLKTNCNRRRPYRFSNPHLWQVVDYSKTDECSTGIADTKSLLFKIERILRKIARKYF